MGNTSSELRDIGIYYWRQQAINVLETAIRNAGATGTKAVPILGTPNHLDTEHLRRFQWTGIVYEGKKSHTKLVPCHTDLEKQFAQFLDSSPDVLRYVKNERFGFSVTYYENNRPRQYYPDFIIVMQDKGGREFFWLAETKGEMRHNTHLKREAAILWSEKMSTTNYGSWRYLLVQQRKFESAIAAKVKTFAELVEALAVAKPGPQLVLISGAEATLVRTTTRGPGRRATVMIAPELTASQRRAVKAFELERWMPTLLSCMTTRPIHT